MLGETKRKIAELFQKINEMGSAHADLKESVERKNKETSSAIANLKANISLLEEEIDDLRYTVGVLKRENKALKEELDNQTKKLNFYLNIETDSGSITENESGAGPIIEADYISRKGREAPSSRQEEDSFTLDPEQEQARQYMDETNDNYFLSGKAGTGKSFLLEAFRSTTKKSTLVLAPTGIAALNVHGATLHSTFGFYNLVNLNVEDISRETLRLKSEKRIILEKVHTIIIDEISMVRADTFEKIDRILQVINESDLPFGGKQILVFGDLFQLPPVVSKKAEYDYLLDRYGGIYFFHSHAFQKGNFKYMELSENHRQLQDKEYFELLNRVREGISTNADVDLLNSRLYVNGSIYDRFTTLFPTKAEAESLNEERIQSLETKEYLYQAKVVYDKYPDKNKSLESIFPITERLKLKEGALVMMVANDIGHRWVNGTMGIVKRLEHDRIYVSINRETFEVHPTVFSEQEVVYENGKIKYEDIFCVEQYPMVLAYAVTIHKSQGQTLRNVVCNINRCFETGQAYVALSRCSSLAGLHLIEPLVLSNIQVDHDVLDFYHSLDNIIK